MSKKILHPDCYEITMIREYLEEKEKPLENTEFKYLSFPSINEKNIETMEPRVILTTIKEKGKTPIKKAYLNLARRVITQALKDVGMNNHDSICEDREFFTLSNDYFIALCTIAEMTPEKIISQYKKIVKK